MPTIYHVPFRFEKGLMRSHLTMERMVLVHVGSSYYWIWDDVKLLQ